MSRAGNVSRQRIDFLCGQVWGSLIIKHFSKNCERKLMCPQMLMHVLRAPKITPAYNAMHSQTGLGYPGTLHHLRLILILRLTWMFRTLSNCSFLYIPRKIVRDDNFVIRELCHPSLIMSPTQSILRNTIPRRTSKNLAWTTKALDDKGSKDNGH